MYFDAPIFKGRRKTSYFNDLEMNIRKRIDGWKAWFLSFGGKLTLLKSVLSPIPIHTLAVRSPPKTGISKIKVLWLIYYGIPMVSTGTAGLLGTAFVNP